MVQGHDSVFPAIVRAYKERYCKMFSDAYKREFSDYASCVLHDRFEGLDWRQLLDWEHLHFTYTKGKLPNPRAELPIDIIVQGKGRCGEFALLYTGLLLTNGYRTRLVVDCSELRDKVKQAAGDHVWVEVGMNGVWIHVDPTEKRIGQPLMYTLDWRKDVNLVYAISENGVVDVTATYTMH